MNNQKVLLIGETHKAIESWILKSKLQITRNIDADSDKVVCIVVRGGHPITESLMCKFLNLKLIISAGIGVDNIDIKNAIKRKILIANCPTASTVSVAEHTIGILLCASRKICRANSLLKDQTWERKSLIGSELFGKKAGIVGLGRIGGHTSKLLSAFGMFVSAFDPFIPDHNFKALGVKRALSLKSLCKQSNYLFVHIPMTSKTRNIINIKVMGLLQKPSGVINTSRGGIVNETDVIKLITASSLGFYGTDVFDSEPKPNNKLIALKEVVATPHIGANTEEAQELIAADVIMQMKEVIMYDKKPIYEVTSNN